MSSGLGLSGDSASHRTAPSGCYGTASSHRRAPDENSDEQVTARHISRRLLSVAAVLLAVFVVTAAVAFADQKADLSHPSRPVLLLSNMVVLSKLAKDATDAMIASDERTAQIDQQEKERERAETSVVRAARTTDLAEGSSLNPLVNPFPNWKYNVFDFDNKTKSHHRWTQRRLREEAKRLMGLVSEAEDWENRKYQQDAQKTEHTKSWLAEERGNITHFEQAADAHMNVIYQGLHVAEKEISGAVRTTGGMMNKMDWNENHYKRKVWEILEEHHGKLNYNKVLQEHHDLLMKSDIYNMENLDEVKMHRYDDKIRAFDNVVDGWIQGVRGRIDANMSIYKSKSVESLYTLNNFSSNEQAHMNTAYGRTMKLQAKTLQTAHETASLGNSVDATEMAITERQRGIAAEITKVKIVVGDVNQSQGHQHEVQEEVGTQVQAMEAKFDGMKQRLATLLSALGTVGSAMTEEQAAHSALVQQENVEMQKMKDAVAGLESQVQSILDLQDTVSDLGVDTGYFVALCWEHTHAYAGFFCAEVFFLRRVFLCAGALRYPQGEASLRGPEGRI